MLKQNVYIHQEAQDFNCLIWMHKIMVLDYQKQGSGFQYKAIRLRDYLTQELW